ncbi:MAG: cardiolipin synthase [Alistipes sp.]
MMYILLIHLFWAVVAIFIITRRKCTPASAGVWILLITLLPVVGTLLYILVGFRRNHSPSIHVKQGAFPLSTLITYNCGTPLARCNRIELLHNGNNAFSALITSLQRATHSIHMEYYIIRDDRIGRSIIEILIRKAHAGVEVRVIYDAVGSCALSRSMLRSMRMAGIEIGAFEPIGFPWFTTRVNHRNHRKIVVTDGKVAYLGGINIAKYYLDGNDLGKWRDEHLRLEGDVVADLQKLFVADWAYVSGKYLKYSSYVASHDICLPTPMQIAWAEEGPSRHTLIEVFTAAIVSARTEVRISSPYFMPPSIILDAIRIAVHSGVCVKVMIPACSDSPFTDLISDSFVEELLDAGVELYRYEKGFLHAKLLIVDDTTASVGTANMDYRSLQDNLEVTAFIYDKGVVRALANTFDEDLDACLRLDRAQWQRRPIWKKAIGDVLRLLSPLM